MFRNRSKRCKAKVSTVDECVGPTVAIAQHHVPGKSCVKSEKSPNTEVCSPTTTDTTGVSDRNMAERAVRFADETIVHPITHYKKGGIKRLLHLSKFHPEELWWSEGELERIRTRDGKLGESDENRLVKSLQVYRMLGSDSINLDDELPAKGSEQSSPPRVGGCDEDFDIPERLRAAVARKLLSVDKEEQNVMGQTDFGYVKIRGLDCWGKLTGRTDEYVKALVYYSKELKRIESSPAAAQERLRRKSRQVTKLSRQWAAALGSADELLSSPKK